MGKMHIDLKYTNSMSNNNKLYKRPERLDYIIKFFFLNKKVT